MNYLSIIASSSFFSCSLYIYIFTSLDRLLVFVCSIGEMAYEGMFYYYYIVQYEGL